MTTPKPIDQLTPEELRVECAEAMGWTKAQLFKYSGVRGIPPNGRELTAIPNYPADANAALTLAHALAEKGWSHSHVCYGGETDFEFFHFGTARPRFRATATGPHAFALALCCAYLAVVRDGKGQIL